MATSGQTTTLRLVKLPSWILTVDKKYSRKGEAVYEGRIASESFVCLPGKSFYNASGRLEPGFQFSQPQDLEPSSVSDHIVPDVHHHDMSLRVIGLLIGTVVWCSDPIPDGVISERCLQKHG